MKTRPAEDVLRIIELPVLPMQKTSLWLARFIALGLSVALALVAIEILVRATGRDRPQLWRPDPKLGWRHVPDARMHWTDEGDGHVTINSLGFRDVERRLTKNADVIRIAVLGDSTTEAVQVDIEQTFCQLLEQRLRQRGVRSEVMNFGVSGYGPLQSYLLYTEDVRRFAPDLVLLATFTDNDVADVRRSLASSQRGAPFLKDAAAEGEFDIDYSAAVSATESYGREPVHTIRRVSALYRMLSAGRQASLGRSASQAGLEATQQVPRRFLLYEEPLGAEWEHAWRTFERVVTRLADTVAQDDVRFAIVSMPAGQVVYPDVWAQLVKEYPAMSTRRWDVLSAEHRLRAIAAAHHIELIEPLDAFVRETSGPPLFFDRIGHLTPRGHEVMARALEAALTERELLTDR